MVEIKPKYVMKAFVLNSHNIEQFHIYETERRKIRQGKVNSMVTGYANIDVNKQHFDSPLVVNKIGSMRNLIDGNHRVESIIAKLERNPEFKIRVWVAEYKDLTREQEREVYSKWNRGTPESNTDYLKWHFPTVPMGQIMLRELPVTIYGNDSCFSIKTLVGAHFEATRAIAFGGGYSAGKEKMLADFRSLTHGDVNLMKAWYSDMVEIFGEYYKGNPFYRGTPVTAFYKIWYDNRNIVNRSKFIRAFKQVFASRLMEWDTSMKSSGREASKFFYGFAIHQLQQRFPTFGFKSWQEIAQDEADVQGMAAEFDEGEAAA